MECVRCKTPMKIQNDQMFSKTYVCPTCGNSCPIDSTAKEVATGVGLAAALLGFVVAIFGFGGDDSST